MKDNKKENFCPSHMSGFKAFTLTEVIVVIVMIAALAVILIPNMLNLMPDDHNIKYKKAFYTAQEMVNDIAGQCQGMKYSSGNWQPIEDEDNVLSYCYKQNGDKRNIATEFCERLATTGDCSTVTVTNMKGILTNNGMRWNFNGGQDLGDNAAWSKTIYVDVDNCGNPKNTFNSDCVGTSTNSDNGVYGITITFEGKVTPATSIETNYLLNNPTDDSD